jgi:hypothetical protein
MKTCLNQQYLRTIMKTIIPIIAMMFLVGCRNNSSNQSNSNNSTPGDPPAVAYPGAQEVYVAGDPPSPLVEVVPPSPGVGFIWIGGAWVWNGSWVWESGHWDRPPHPGAIWIPHRYGTQDGRHVFIRGGWK